MSKTRNLHPDFLKHLSHYDIDLAQLYFTLRNFVLEIYPDANELLYHTHALVSVYSPTTKLMDAFCHIPIYSNHFNLGFNKGTLLDDRHQILQGTGKLIRHISIKSISDFDNEKVKELLEQAIHLSIHDLENQSLEKGLTISKIKT